MYPLNAIYVYYLIELSSGLVGVLGFGSNLDRVKEFEKKNWLLYTIFFICIYIIDVKFFSFLLLFCNRDEI